jgi:hypothetical protein
MFKFVGKALAGLVLTQDAQQALERKAKTAGATGAGKVAPAPDPQSAAERRAEQVARMFLENEELVAENRAILISEAMKVRTAKKAILADLDDQSRAKLVALAMKRLLNEGRDPE